MLLRLENVSKSFFGNKVLDSVDLEVGVGEVHAIIGGNGAGKSTLINIVSGALAADSGKVFINDRQVEIRNAQDAKKAGISVIYQTPSIIPNMSVAENIFLGMQPRIFKVFVNTIKMYREASRILRLLGITINPTKPAKLISPREHYLISIARAICHKAKIMIMDEPTASLSEEERQNLFSLIRKYKQEGMGIIYITHRLEEIPQICDRVTILRDGKQVMTSNVEALPLREMTKLMMGREIEQYFPPLQRNNGSELLRVEDLSKLPALQNINFTLRKGEIVGITGLASSGKSVLARTIFGQLRRDGGKIFWKGEPIHFKHPFQALQQRFGYVDENRLKAGLFMNMNVNDNLTMSSLDKLNRWQFFEKKEAMNLSLEQIMDLDIKVDDVKQAIEVLSGGNQQKVMLGRCLMADSEMYLLDEPTQGIDVASRSDIYIKIHELAEMGKGILIISSDVTELLGLCTRIMVMRQGRLVGNVLNDQVTENDIIQLMIEVPSHASHLNQA
jgi:ABC-type sugar transport system ATPase subunit